MNQHFTKGITCTKSAFCQARKKLKLCFFEDFLATIVSSFYKNNQSKTFKQHYVWACDTTCQLLPNNEATRQIGIHKNQHKSVASVKISVYFDVFSKLITSAELFDKRSSDLVCCLENQVKNVPQNVIAVYDRGYGSQVLAFFHNSYQSKFVIRLRVDFSKTVKDFMQSADNERYITEPLTEKAYKRLEKWGIRKSKLDTISYRLVKVVLSTGEIEVLMTNLDKTFTISDLSELYHLRWGIETCFFCLKSCQMLGIFSGYSTLVVKQDIFISILFYNLQTIVQIEAEAKAAVISAKRKSKPSKNKKNANQGYKVNRNVGINTLRMQLKELFTSTEQDLIGLFKNMETHFLLSLEIVKITTKERKRKMLRQNDRHQTELNYKSGF